MATTMKSTASGPAALMRALSARNFRNFVIGSGCSMIGTWTQKLAVGWLTWKLTESGTWLGVISFADILPGVALLPLTGAVADRVDRLRLLRITQILLFIQAAALAAITSSGLMTIWILFGLTLCSGTITAFNQPVRLAVVPNLVERSDMAAAIGIHSMLFNVARFVGPALAGLVIATVGLGAAFAVNAATYIVNSIALIFVRMVQEEEVPARKPIRDIPLEVFAAFRYGAGHTGIGGLMVLTLITGICVRPYVELLPGFAAKVFDQGVHGLAMMTSTVGVGAILGGLWISQRGRVSGLFVISNAMLLALIAALLVFSQLHSFWPALSMLAVGGFCMSAMGVSQQILVQTAVEGGMRGRILGVYGLLSRGAPGLGALIMGSLSAKVGLQTPIAGGAILCLGVWYWYWRRREVMTRTLELGSNEQLAPAARRDRDAREDRGDARQMEPLQALAQEGDGK